MSVNKVILVGNVGKDPEVRYLESGVALARFPFATSETYKSKEGERITTTEWHNIVLWRGLAEVAEKYIKKGSQLYIEGRIRTRSYDDRDGNKRYMTEIIADQMQMLGRRSDSEGPSNSDKKSGSGNSPSGQNQESGGSYGDSYSTGSSDDTPFGDSSGGADDLPF